MCDIYFKTVLVVQCPFCAYVVVLIVTDQKDLLITAKDFPGVKIGDVLEIYHPEEEFRSVGSWL